MSNGANPSIDLGGNGVLGTITLRAPDGEEGVRLGGEGNINVKGSLSSTHLNTRSLFLTNDANEPTLALNSAGLFVVGSGADVTIALSKGAGHPGTRLLAGTLWLSNAAGQTTASLGSESVGGLSLSNEAGHTTVDLHAGIGGLTLGGGGVDGRITLKNSADQETISINVQDSRITLKNPAGQETISINGADGTIQLDGDIVLRNADCAEDFDIAESQDQIEPGTIMVLDQDGKLHQSQEAYDKKVVGVISGAGNWKPGIVLDKRPPQNNRMPLALVGKVYCKVDAHYSPVEVGDLLTTSPTPGHAMRADDPVKAFGAVIGKALHSLNAGKGLIPIIVALQ